MKVEFSICQNDTNHKVDYQLADTAGTALSLVGYSSCHFLFYRLGSGSEEKGATQTRTATVVDASAGKVRYTLLSTDIATTGLYAFWWRVVLADGERATIPTGVPLYFRVVDDPST